MCMSKILHPARTLNKTSENINVEIVLSLYGVSCFDRTSVHATDLGQLRNFFRNWKNLVVLVFYTTNRIINISSEMTG